VLIVPNPDAGSSDNLSRGHVASHSAGFVKKCYWVTGLSTLVARDTSTAAALRLAPWVSRVALNAVLSARVAFVTS